MQKGFHNKSIYTWGCEILSYSGEEGPTYIKVCNKRMFFPCGPTYNISTLKKRRKYFTVRTAVVVQVVEKKKKKSVNNTSDGNTNQQKNEANTQMPNRHNEKTVHFKT